MAHSADSSSLRKAAVLIRSLDADSAAQLLARLAPQESQALREAVRGVDAIDDQELSAIAAELQYPTKSTIRDADPKSSAVVLELSDQANGGRGQASETGRPLDSRLNSQLADLRQLAASANAPPPPFQALLETDARTLVEFLEREHAQTIAVVLSYLAAQKAAEILDALGNGRQEEVIQRLSDLGETDTESLRVVEQNLQEWLTMQRREQTRRADRMSIVGSILASTQNSTRQTVLLRLRQQDRHLAERIESQLPKGSYSQKNERVTAANGASPQSFQSRAAKATGPTSIHDAGKPEEFATGSTCTTLSFDDLAELSAISLTAVLRTVDSEILRCALIGVSDRLLKRVEQVLPRQQRKELQRQLRSIRPTRLSDVEAARQVVADGADRLMKQGLIEPPKRLAG